MINQFNFELLIYLLIGLSGIIAFTSWGVFLLLNKYFGNKRKLKIHFHSYKEDGSRQVSIQEVDREKYFNFSQRELKKARKYIKYAIQNNKLNLGTTLEQQNEVIEEAIEEAIEEEREKG